MTDVNAVSNDRPDPDGNNARTYNVTDADVAATEQQQNPNAEPVDEEDDDDAADDF